MRTFGVLAFAALVGYGVGAVIGYVVIMQFSSNRHDRQMEAATTGALMTGPFIAILMMIAAWIWIV